MDVELAGALRQLEDNLVSHVERIVDERFTPLRDEMLSHFDGVYQRLDRLETEYYAIREALGRLETRMDALEARMDALEKRMDGLEARMTALEKSNIRREIDLIKVRIAELEQRVAQLEAQL